MNPKDEFLAFQQQKNDKLSFAADASGRVTHVVKRVDLRLYDVFSELQALRCPQLPAILRLVRQDDCLEVHEEYIRGKTLDALRRETGAFDDDMLLAAAADVCRALAVLHGAEPPIVHRDIKPENIMRRDGGGYVLIDFDAARLYREEADTDTRCIATVGYAAPEQYGLSQTDARSDLFSLGVTLYELKTNESYRMGAVCGGLLKHIVKKCTAFSPDRRYQNVRQLQKQLDALQPKRRKRARRLRWTAAVLGGAAILAAAVLIPPRRSEEPMQDAVAAVAASASPSPAPQAAACSCRFSFDGALTNEPLIIGMQDGPVSVQLEPTGDYVRTGCTAPVHAELASLRGCSIYQASVGSSAVVSDSGYLTIYKEGVYYIDAILMYHGKAVLQLTDVTVVATEHPDAYQTCRCVVDTRASLLPFHSEQRLPADGGPLYLPLYWDISYDRRICTASEHIEAFWLPLEVLTAPEGADYGVTDDGRFYAYTPGTYSLYMPRFFKDDLIGGSIDIWVS